MSDPLISLCIIVHNEQAVIERFVKSFRHVYDELCVVRAVGDEPPDDTLHLCEGIGATCAEYKNAIPGLAHIDDFAAARNQSFDLATGKYVMWADADDIISDHDATRIRGWAETSGLDALKTSYDTGNDRTPDRIRLIRRGTGRWISPIHEDILMQDGATGDYLPDIVIRHRPISPTRKHSERNITLIKRQLYRTADFHYYLHHDYYLMGDYDHAAEVGVKALAFHELGETERYEILLNLSFMAKDQAAKKEYALQAAGLCPWRREAFALLACQAMDMENSRDALAYARMYSNMPMPANPPWNLQRRWYDWLGAQLAYHCQRYAGGDDQATKGETDLFVANGAMFSLIHATQGRPEKCKDTRFEWFVKADHPKCVEHIFAVDHYDRETLKAVKPYRHVVCTPGGSCCQATNQAAAKSEGKFLVNISDDTHPPRHWDTLLLAIIGDRDADDAVVIVSDGHNDPRELQTTQIMTRTRYRKQGWFFHPDFLSMYGDKDFTARGIEQESVIDATSVVIEHRHPLYSNNGEVKSDATYAHTNDPDRYRQGLEAFKKLHPVAMRFDAEEHGDRCTTRT